MKDLIKATSKLSMSTGINVVCIVIRSKILAITVGAAGVGVISQLTNVSALFFSFLPIGSLGLVRYISEYYHENRIRKINYLIRIFLMQNLPVVLGVSILCIVYSHRLSELVFSDSSYSYIIIIFSFSLPLGLISSFIDVYLKGLNIVKQFVKYSSITALLSLCVFIPLQIFFKLEGAVLAFSSWGIINLIVGLRLLRKLNLVPSFKNASEVRKDVIRNIYKIGIASMVMAIAQQLTFLLSKSVIAYRLGLHDIGLYQSVFSISSNYFGLFFVIIGTYSIPKLSSFKNPAHTLREINNTLRLLVLIFTPLIILSFVLRNYLLIFLYSSEFIQAKDLFFYQLPGDFMKALSWVFGLWLIPSLRIKEWLIFDLLFDINFFGVFYYLITIEALGVKSMSIAYFAAYAIHAVINLVYIRYSLKFRFENRNLVLLVLSASTILLVFGLSQYYELAGYFVILPVLTVWLLLSVRRNEFQQVKAFLSEAVAKYGR